MSKLKFYITRSSGFTLIELLVVVAVLGILAAVGTVSYNGYVKSAKKSSAENFLQQASLAQLEYYTNTGEYYPSGTADTCSANEDTSKLLGQDLFGDEKYIAYDEMEFYFCSYASETTYTILAEDQNSDCQISLTKNQAIQRENCS